MKLTSGRHTNFPLMVLMLSESIHTIDQRYTCNSTLRYQGVG